MVLGLATAAQLALLELSAFAGFEWQNMREETKTFYWLDKK